MNWVEKTLGRTRGELLALLRRSRASINELAAMLGITDNAVRTHVAALQRDGMVQTAGVARDTGGKPAQLYEITPEAEEMFPKAYAFVLGSLLELLAERNGKDDVIALLREVGARAAETRAPAAHTEAEVRVAAAAELLRQLGGEVDVERVESGWSIRGHGCPLSAVVAEHAEVCALAESLVATVSRLEVTECCDRSGRPRCNFRVTEASRPANGPAADARPGARD